MRHVRRLVAILVGCAAWCMAATTVAYAQLPDPGGGPIVPPPDSGASSVATDMPVWQIAAMAALGVLLALAVVGLVLSLRHARTSEPSHRTERTPRSPA